MRNNRWPVAASRGRGGKNIPDPGLLTCHRHAKARRLAQLLACLCAFFQATPGLAQDYVIGVVAGMTGLGKSYGIGIAQGAEMAVNDVNAAGGIDGRKLGLVMVDDNSSPARSAIAMRRLTSGNSHLIVGGWGSPQVLAGMDIAEQAAIPYIVVGATNPTITSPRNRWTFRVIPSDGVMADQLAAIATAQLGNRRIAVINDSNDYGVGNRDIFLAALARAGVKPVEVQSFQTADTDFRPQLRRILAANPDTLAIFGTIPAAPAIMNQAREIGILARFIGTGGLANESLISLAPAASAGTILTTFFSEETDPAARAWAERYRKEFANRPEPPQPVLAAWEYRAIHDIAAPCLRRVGGDRLKLRECIAGWRGRPFGVTAEAHFDTSGQLIQPAVVVEVRDKAFRLMRAEK